MGVGEGDFPFDPYRQYFTTSDLIEIDHIVPRSLGGKDEYKNLQLLHRHCHDIQVLVHDNVSDALLKASQSFDLVVLRSMRRRTAGGLAVSDVTTEMIKSLTCSFILFGEPHS